MVQTTLNNVGNLGHVSNVYNPITQEAEAGRWQILHLSGLLTNTLYERKLIALLLPFFITGKTTVTSVNGEIEIIS